jgi:signal transduction histidine kinase
MKRFGLRAKLLIGMFAILCISIGLVAGQAVVLFQQDKSSYVFDLNASQAIRIADEIQANARHLTEKMRIFSGSIVLKAPEGVDPRDVLRSMLQQYPEFLLFSQHDQGQLLEIFRSPALKNAGLSVPMLHEAYTKGGIPFDTLITDRPFLTHLDLSRTLPTFTLAVRAKPGPTGGGGKVLVAECPLSRLFSTRSESGLYEIYVTDGRGKPFISFTGTGAVSVAADQSGSASFEGLLPESAQTAGTREYMAAGVPMLAAYAPVGDLGLWTVVQIPKARALAAARRLVIRSLVIAGIVCLAGIGLVLLFASSISKPLVALTGATEQIGQGKFDVQIPVSGGDEIGQLGDRFKRMTQELSTREKALNDANVRLMESEKMTALGQLGAGIAHEVKNPLTSIRGYAQMGIRKVPDENPLKEYFRTIEKETGRSLEILKNLLKFSRQETAEMSRIDLNVVVSDTVKLVTHQLSMRKVELVSNIFDAPLWVQGNANQIEQVLLNLFMNAGDAMAKGGTVTASTDANDGQARIQIADTGSGIPPDVLAKIFNPFFTTKPVGKGTGLGLSVSYGIIKEHKGDISAKSDFGIGTTFTIQIPLLEEPGESVLTSAAGGEQRLRVISLR